MKNKIEARFDGLMERLEALLNDSTDVSERRRDEICSEMDRVHVLGKGKELLDGLFDQCCEGSSCLKDQRYFLKMREYGLIGVLNLTQSAYGDISFQGTIKIHYDIDGHNPMYIPDDDNRIKMNG